MLKSLANVKIKTTGLFIAAILLLVAAIVVTVSAFAIRETRDMARAWSRFDAGPAKKTVALGKLRGALGYGGTIHEFRNFIIRQDRQRIVNIHVALLDATVALTAYDFFGVNDAERTALAELNRVLTLYSEAVAVVERMASEGASILDIDKAVRIDDTPAIRAMAVLDRELEVARERSSSQVQSSVAAVTAIVSVEAAVVTFLIGVLIALFLWFTLWRLVRPLSALGAAIENFDMPSMRDIGGLDRRLDTNGPREIAELAATFNDMTAKLDHAAKREKELRVFEARLAGIVDIASDAIITVDQDQRISTFNKGAAQIFGYAAEDLIGQPIDFLIPEAFRAKHDEHFAAFARSQFSNLGMSGRGEIAGLRKDGTVFPAEASIAKFELDGETVFIVILRDITERQRVQDELKQAQKLEAVGQLAGGIAHEINTPAQYIGDNLKFLTGAHSDLFSLVEKSMALSEEARGHSGLSALAENIDAVREKIDLDYLREEIPSATEQSLAGIGQVSRIVLAMKEFSHPGTKEMSSTDINRALENTITVSSNEWKHAAEITTALDPDLPSAPCFAGELNQVFLNLIVNAAHAAADRPDRSGLGQIKVSTGTDGENVVIRIEDDGCGIPEKIRDQIFDPFFTTKEVGQGTGQGLSIAHDIVVMKHGGTIAFDTETGKGTTFIVTLPIKNSTAAQASPPAGDESGRVFGA